MSQRGSQLTVVVCLGPHPPAALALAPGSATADPRVDLRGVLALVDRAIRGRQRLVGPLHFVLVAREPAVNGFITIRVIF